MSNYLRNQWLRPVLEHRLQAAVHDLESYVPGTHLQTRSLLVSPDRVEIVVEKKQQAQVISEVELEAGCHQILISDGTSHIAARFTNESVEGFQKQYGREISVIKGAILTIAKYHLIVSSSPQASQPLSLEVSAFKLIGSEGSKTFGNPTAAATGHIKKLCAEILFRLQPFQDSDGEGEIQPSDKFFSRTQASEGCLQSQVNFHTQLVTNEHTASNTRKSLLTQDPAVFQKKLLRNITQSQSPKCRFTEQLIVETTPEDPHPHKCHNAESSASSVTSSHSQFLPRARSESQSNDDKSEGDNESDNTEAGQKSHVKTAIDNLSSVNQLLFVDHFHQIHPFAGMRRVPRKFARISRAQAAQLESDCWYRKNGADGQMSSILPETVKKSLETFLDSIGHESGDEEQDEEEADSEANDDSFSAALDLGMRANSLPSLQISFVNHSEEMEDGSMSDKHEQSVESDAESDDGQELPPLPLNSLRAEPLSKAIDITLKQDNHSPVEEELIRYEQELAVPITMSGFSSDVDCPEPNSITFEQQDKIINMPSTAANKRLVVHVERTPFIPTEQRPGNRDLSDLYGISSDPIIPATIWEPEKASQIDRPFHNHSPSGDIQDEERPMSHTNAIDFAIPEPHQCTAGSQPRASPMDSSPIRLLSEDNHVMSEQAPLDMAPIKSTKQAKLVKTQIPRAQYDISSGHTEPSSSASGIVSKDRRLGSRRVRVGEPAWYKRVAAMIAKEKDSSTRDTKLLSSKDRRQFKVDQDRSRELQLQEAMRDPELTPLVQFSDDPYNSHMGLIDAPIAPKIVANVDTSPDVLPREGANTSSASSPNVHPARISFNPTLIDTRIHRSQSVSEQSLSTHDIAPVQLWGTLPGRILASQQSNSNTAYQLRELKDDSFEQFQASINHIEVNLQTSDSAADLHIKEEAVGSISTPKSLSPRPCPSTQDRNLVEAVIKADEDHDMLELYDASPPRIRSMNAAKSPIPYLSPYGPVPATDRQDHNSAVMMTTVLENGTKSSSPTAHARSRYSAHPGVLVRSNEGQNFFARFCTEYPQYTGNQSGFTLALVYIEYLLNNGMFGHSHMCDDFIRFYPEDYLALHGDKVKISGWELFKKKVRRPEFEADVISADNLMEALNSLKEKEVARMRSKFAVRDQRLFFGSTAAAASHASTTSTRQSSPMLVEYRQANDTPAGEEFVAHQPVADDEELSLFVENNRSPPVSRKPDLRSISPPKQAPRPRQPFFETASQQPQKRKASSEVVSTPPKRRTLPWVTSKQLTPQRLLATPRNISPLKGKPQQDSPILGDPNAVPRTARSTVNRLSNPFIDTIKARGADRRRTLGTATVLESKNFNSSARGASRSVTGSAQKQRKGLDLMISDSGLFRKYLERNLAKERDGSRRSSISSWESLTPGASPGVSGISLKLKPSKQ